MAGEQRYPISVKRGGRTYEGHYYMATHRAMIVQYGGYDRKTHAPAGGSKEEIEAVARLELEHLIADIEAKRF